MGRGKCDPPYYEEGEDDWLEQRLQQLQQPQLRPRPRCVTLRKFCIVWTCFNIVMNVFFIVLGVFFIATLETNEDKKFKKLPKNEQTPEKHNKLVSDIKTNKTMGIVIVVYLALALLILAPLFVLLKKKDEKLLKYHSRVDLSFLLDGLILSILYLFISYPDATADTINGNLVLLFAFANMIFYRANGIYFLERYRHQLLLPEGQEVGVGNVDALILGIGLMAEDGARADGSTAANVQAEAAPAIINTAAPEGDQNNTSSS